MRPLPVAALLAASLALAACDPPEKDDMRVIVTAGPVYEVPARDAPRVRPIPQRPGRGTMVLEGGGASLDLASQWTVALAGSQPVLCLIDTAAGGAGDPYHKFDAVGGFKMLTVDVTPGNAAQARIIEALESCTGYFINGGDPVLLSTAFRPNVQDSPALKVIRQRFEQQGAVVAGTGAGAMIVGDFSLCECGPESSVDALVGGKLPEAPGFVFVHGVLIDTRFFSRGLIGRHLYALADSREPVGIGINDTTAVVVPGDGGLWQVIGDGGVALIRRGTKATTARLEGFSISLLNAGDRFDPSTGRIVIAPTRKPVAMGRDPRAPPVEINAIFEPDRVRALILALAQSESLAAAGYDDASRMAVRLRKRPDSSAYGDGSSLSVLHLELAIAPS